MQKEHSCGGMLFFVETFIVDLGELDIGYTFLCFYLIFVANSLIGVTFHFFSKVNLLFFKERLDNSVPVTLITSLLCLTSVP